VINRIWFVEGFKGVTFQSAAGAKHALQIVKDAIADIFKEVKNE